LAFFQLHPISDVEDLAMKLFSATLHDNARRWYNNLPNASITSMDKLEEVFLRRWSVKVNPNILLMRLNYLTKAENETAQEFHDKFERIVQQIPVSHHPSSSFLTFLYTKAFFGQSEFLLDIREPRTIQEAFDIATEVEAKIPSSKKEQSVVLEVKIDEVVQDLIPPARKEEDEVNQFPFHVFDDTLFYDSKDEVERESLYELEDKALVIAPPFDEVIQISEALAQEEVSIVSCFPLQDFDDALFYDLGSKQVLKEPLFALIPSCYDEENNLVTNIDVFIHVGRRKWDVIGYDMDPTYDIENHFQVLPLQLSHVTPNLDIGQQ
jgi:hypothetical protein